MENSEEIIKRGVCNPKVIDLITPSSHAAKATVTLTMLEDREWLESEAMLEELEAKFNSYLDYILDGWLVKHYPQYQHHQVNIELRSKSPIPPTLAPRLEAIRRCCEKFSLGFDFISDPTVDTSPAATA